MKFKPIDETFSKLEDGMVFKNYRELCEFLSQPTTTGGNAKRMQHETFERYFEYHKDGHKYVIDNVYLEPLSAISNETYTTLIQKLLLDYLARYKHETGADSLLLSKNQLYEMVGLITDKYTSYMDNKSSLSKMLEAPLSVVEEFYSFTSSKLSGYVGTSLKALARRSVINIKHDVIIIKNMNYGIHEADIELEKRLLEKEYETLVEFSDKYNISTKDKITHFMIVNRGLWKEFTSVVSEKLRQEGVDIRYYYRGHSLTLTKNIDLEKERVDRYILENKDEIVKALNAILVSSYKQSYVDRHKKSVEIVNNEDSFTEVILESKYKTATHLMRADKLYPEHGSNLIDATIKI